MSERKLVRRIQHKLESLYGVEAPSIEDFVEVSDARENVLVRRRGGALEIRVHLPPEAMLDAGAVSLDRYVQIVEGVSHFLMLVERARRALPTTQLELELQAEVDKFVLLSRLVSESKATTSLYENVRYLHAPSTTRGQRYRLASALAAKFVTSASMRSEGALVVEILRRFFGAGQREKIEMVMAA